MKQFSYVLNNGLHARPMAGLLKEASRFASKICLCSGESVAELGKGKLPAINLPSGSLVTVTVEGKDEEAAVAAMQNHFVANM